MTIIDYWFLVLMCISYYLTGTNRNEPLASLWLVLPHFQWRSWVIVLTLWKKNKRSKLKRCDWSSILLDMFNMWASRFPPPVESIMLSVFYHLQPSCSWLVGCSSDHLKTKQIRGSEDGPAILQSWITAIQLLCEIYRRHSISTGDNWRQKDNTVTTIKVALRCFVVARRHNVKTCQA